MRSRNGNYPLTRALCLLILLPSLWAEEYIISYRVVAKNALLLNETLTLSPAMVPCHGTPAQSIELYTEQPDDLRYAIESNYDAFFHFIDRSGLHLRHYATTTNLTGQDHTILTLPPQCFTVDFNEFFVKISALN